MVFVLPNPSGRNANFSYEQMRMAFTALVPWLSRDNGSAIASSIALWELW